MTTAIVGIASDALIPPRSKIRATFDNRTLLGETLGIFKGSNAAADYYAVLVDQLPVMGLGYVASPNSAVPDAEAFTVDIRSNADAPPLSAATFATMLDGISSSWELSRMEVLGDTSAGAAADQSQRDAATLAVATQPSILEKLAGAGQSVGKWFLWILALAAVLLLLWFFRK